jgi:hypothetical protein
MYRTKAAEKPKKMCLAWLLLLLFLSHPTLAHPGPSHRRAFGSAVQRVYMLLIQQQRREGTMKKGKNYIHKKATGWKVCFFILRKNILRIFSKFGLM